MVNGKEYNEEKGEKLKEAVGWLNSMLEGRQFVAGDKLSIADITTVVTMSNLDVSIKEWVHSLEKKGSRCYE